MMRKTLQVHVNVPKNQHAPVKAHQQAANCSKVTTTEGATEVTEAPAKRGEATIQAPCTTAIPTPTRVPLVYHATQTAGTKRNKAATTKGPTTTQHSAACTTGTLKSTQVPSAPSSSNSYAETPIQAPAPCTTATPTATQVPLVPDTAQTAGTKRSKAATTKGSTTTQDPAAFNIGTLKSTQVPSAPSSSNSYAETPIQAPAPCTTATPTATQVPLVPDTAQTAGTKRSKAATTKGSTTTQDPAAFNIGTLKSTQVSSAPSSSSSYAETPIPVPAPCTTATPTPLEFL